jgi:Spy/CpxP family protein refolding chaperone
VTLKYGDADIKATLDQVAKTRKALEAERDKFDANLASILTPTQRAKMLVARSSWGAGRRHGFGERRFGKGRFGQAGRDPQALEDTEK